MIARRSLLRISLAGAVLAGLGCGEAPRAGVASDGRVINPGGRIRIRLLPLAAIQAGSPGVSLGARTLSLSDGTFEVQLPEDAPPADLVRLALHEVLVHVAGWTQPPAVRDGCFDILRSLAGDGFDPRACGHQKGHA